MMDSPEPLKDAGAVHHKAGQQKQGNTDKNVFRKGIQNNKLKAKAKLLNEHRIQGSRQVELLFTFCCVALLCAKVWLAVRACCDSP